LDQAAQRLDRAAAMLTSPAQRLAHQQERLNTLRHRLASAWRGPQGHRVARLDMLAQRLAHRRPDTGRAAERSAALLAQL
ncbi:exodeoxyribonuclease VII large subunit, partial [Bordetella pertussis]